MKGSRTRLRKVLPEREREEAAVPEAIERLISRGPPAGSGIPFEAWGSWHRYGFIACPASKLRHTCSDHCCRRGADCRELDGPLRPTARLSCYRDFDDCTFVDQFIARRLRSFFFRALLSATPSLPEVRCRQTRKTQGYRSVSMNTSQPISPNACLILFFALSAAV